MSDAESLLAIVVAVYLSECAQWITPHAVVLGAPWRKRWRVVSPHFVFGNDRGALVWGNPLPPLGPAITTQPWPVALSPEGVCIAGAEASNAAEERGLNSVAWDDVKKVVAHGQRIFVNGQLFATTSSIDAARHLSRALQRGAAAPHERRASVIDRAIHRSLDDEAARRRLAIYRKRSKTLAVLCNLFCVCFFGGSAALVWWSDARSYWPALLAALVVLMIGTLVQFRRVFHKLHRRRKREWRRHLWMMLLSPMATIRACDVVLRPALSKFHPLAAALALCQGEDLRLFAREALCEVQFPLPSESGGDVIRQTIRAWFNDHLTAAMESAIRRAGFNASELLAPPTPEGDDCRTYCPRCFTQFSILSGNCEPCGSVALRPIP